MMPHSENVTPLMKQYNSIKEKYPDAILLFRVGDYYETFNDDAVVVASTVGILVTRNKSGNKLAGFPHYSLESYLPKIVKAGYKVAVCDQLEDPKLKVQGEALVKREVTDYKKPERNFQIEALQDEFGGRFIFHQYTDGRLSACAQDEVVVEINIRGVKDYKEFRRKLKAWIRANPDTNKPPKAKSKPTTANQLPIEQDEANAPQLLKELEARQKMMLENKQAYTQKGLDRIANRIEKLRKQIG